MDRWTKSRPRRWKMLKMPSTDLRKRWWVFDVFFWFRCLGWNATSGESSASQVWLASFQSDVITIDLQGLQTNSQVRSVANCCCQAQSVEGQSHSWSSWGKQQFEAITLQGTNISHLGKRKIIFKSALGWDMLISNRLSNSLVHSMHGL